MNLTEETQGNRICFAHSRMPVAPVGGGLLGPPPTADHLRRWLQVQAVRRHTGGVPPPPVMGPYWVNRVKRESLHPEKLVDKGDFVCPARHQDGGWFDHSSSSSRFQLFN